MEQPIKVLIVDDHAENLFVLESILKRLHVSVIKAQSGNQALTLMLEHQFALAMLDVQMPQMDGYELAELMRSDERCKDIPIIFVSAIFSDDFHVFKGYQSGAVDFISKPFNPEILLGKVRVFINLAEQRQQLERVIVELEKSRFQLKAQNEQMHEDLVLAGEVQNTIFSRVASSNFLKMAVHYQPYEHISGDVYHVRPSGEGGVNLFVGDVTGHGVAAALITVIISRILDEDLHRLSTSKVLEKLNKVCKHKLPLDRFMTGVCLRIQADGTIQYSFAGHPPMILVPAQAEAPVLSLWEQGLMLGVAMESQYEEHTFHMQHGDKLFMMTDGLMESQAYPQRMNHDTILQLFEKTRHEDLDTMMKNILESTIERPDFKIQDDVTLAGIEYLA
ncbi:MAG: SpoIIE family protein phosphatase [SAR324 cluster bacterium]|nr:SpoIIE family protein phosphatase [SAR324 cluster bacterium]